MRTTLTAVALLAVAAVACKPPAETADQMAARMQAETDSARTAIAAQNRRFEAAMAAGSADSLAALYAENGSMMAPNMMGVTSRDSIRAAFGPMMQAGKSMLTLNTVTVSANGPMAVERGTYHFTFTPTRGPAQPDSGKYLVHWHNVNGTWLMSDDIWNSDAPMAPPAPAPRRARS
jgi:uncharacterized protein (TIGR02246 family)